MAARVAQARVAVGGRAAVDLHAHRHVNLALRLPAAHFLRDPCLADLLDRHVRSTQKGCSICHLDSGRSLEETMTRIAVWAALFVLAAASSVRAQGADSRLFIDATAFAGVEQLAHIDSQPSGLSTGNLSATVP